MLGTIMSGHDEREWAGQVPPRSDLRDGWDYATAFSRNLGLISPAEQERLHTSRVAIPGMGGVGGVHLLTLARLGVGRFRIADPDSFDLANINRQFGAELSSLGRNKAGVMAERVRAINPELEVEVYDEPITAGNAGRFLEGADILLDGIDFFAFVERRLLFAEARQRGLWGITAGPIGFSAAWLLFDPAGMAFEKYFDLREGMAPVDQFASFLVGLTPRGTHFPYLDLSYVDRRTGRGPSAGLACMLCAGVAAAETLKILLGRGPLRPAPCYAQFDAYRGLFRRGRIRWGNRHPVQRLKRAFLRRKMLTLGYDG